LKMKNNFKKKEKTLLPVLTMISRKQKKWFSSNYIFVKILEKSSLLTSDWPRHFEFFFFFLILVYSLIIRSYYSRHVFSFATSNSIFLSTINIRPPT
jgi:hypothetical protein